MDTLLVVLLVVVVLALVALTVALAKRRAARREVLRERTERELHGHRQEAGANAEKAREVAAVEAQERERAERLRQAANEAEASAEDLTAQRERAAGAAQRHDEKAQVAERDLENL